MTIKFVPNALGNVFVEEVEIKKESPIITLKNRGRLECRIGKVVSEGVFNGQYVLYHFAKSKEYRYDHKRLTIVKIMDIIAIAEIDSSDLVSEPISADMKWCAEGVNTCGLPEVEDYRGEK
jgi:co-chaperonin GroES (HSP10)